ncbi:MAG: hypothetical protein LBN03_01640 [Bifidobacteriaceae bacterium]|nr:hypothetical protein [Bifidobacteriaceae bacterium]
MVPAIIFYNIGRSKGYKDAKRDLLAQSDLPHPQPVQNPLEKSPLVQSSQDQYQPDHSNLAQPQPQITTEPSKLAPINPPQKSSNETANIQTRNINIMLYVASFLIVAATAAFIGTNVGSSTKLFGVFLIAALFYCAGIFLYKNKNLSNLRPAAIAFVGTGLAIIPFIGVALSVLGNFEPQTSWFITSILGVITYMYAASQLKSQVISYLSFAFVLSLVNSAVSIANLEIYWYFISMVLFSILAQLVMIFSPKYVPKTLSDPLINLGNFITPVALIASLTLINLMDPKQYEIVFSLATIQYILQYILRRNPNELLIGRVTAHIAILLIFYFEISSKPLDFSWAYFTVAFAQALVSLFIILNNKKATKFDEYSFIVFLCIAPSTNLISSNSTIITVTLLLIAAVIAYFSYAYIKIGNKFLGANLAIYELIASIVFLMSMINFFADTYNNLDKYTDPFKGIYTDACGTIFAITTTLILLVAIYFHQKRMLIFAKNTNKDRTKDEMLRRNYLLVVAQFPGIAMFINNQTYYKYPIALIGIFALAITLFLAYISIQKTPNSQIINKFAIKTLLISSSTYSLACLLSYVLRVDYYDYYSELKTSFLHQAIMPTDYLIFIPFTIAIMYFFHARYLTKNSKNIVLIYITHFITALAGYAAIYSVIDMTNKLDYKSEYNIPYLFLAAYFLIFSRLIKSSKQNIIYEINSFIISVVFQIIAIFSYLDFNSAQLNADFYAYCLMIILGICLIHFGLKSENVPFIKLSTRGLLICESGTYIIALGFCALINKQIPSMDELVYVHIIAATVFAWGYVLIRYVKQNYKITRIVLALGLLTLWVGTLALNDGGSYVTLFLAEQAILLAIGGFTKITWATKWGAAGVICAVLYFVRDYTYIWLGLLGIGIISIVIWRLRSADNPNDKQ